MLTCLTGLHPESASLQSTVVCDTETETSADRLQRESAIDQMGEIEARDKTTADAAHSQSTATTADTTTLPAKSATIVSIPVGSKLANDQTNLFWFGAFPELYPFGAGGPFDSRPEKLSFEEYVQHLMWLADPRFRTNLVLCGSAFNVRQRHLVMLGTVISMRLGRLANYDDVLSKLTPERLQPMLRDLVMASKQHRSTGLHHIKDKATRDAMLRCYKDLQFVGGHIPLNRQAKKEARKELFALTARFGRPAFFLTVNPNDHNSVLVLNFHGMNISFDVDSPTGFSQIPSYRKRRSIVCRDPLASARYSHAIINAFVTALLGWQSESSTLGIFGDVSAFHFNSEEQNRGSIHWHGLVWLKHHPSPEQFKLAMADSSFQQRLLAYHH